MLHREGEQKTSILHCTTGFKLLEHSLSVGGVYPFASNRSNTKYQ